MSSDPVLEAASADLDYALAILQRLTNILGIETSGILKEIGSLGSFSDGNGDHARSGQVLSGNADMERLQAENKELRDKLDLMNATIATHEEDFRKEREDRVKCIEKLGQSEARTTELQCKLDAYENIENEKNRELVKKLEAATEEIAVKVAQVKQYQKQVEAYKQAQQFEQLYNEEKQRNAQLLEEIDQLKKNQSELLYNKERQINAHMEEIHQSQKGFARALSIREERSISNSSQQPQNHPEPSVSKATTEPAHSRDSDDDLPPPVMLPKAYHPPNTFSHLPQSSRPAAHQVEEVTQMTPSVEIPFDPNLKCPICHRMFRKGEIQLYRQHVKLCRTVPV